MREILIIIFFGLGCVSVQAQKFSKIYSDFSILEKHTGKDTSFLVIGKLLYDLYENKTTYDVSFPEKKTWEFQDSLLTVYDSLSQVEKIDTVGLVSEFSIFGKILKEDLANFGLEEVGFTVTEVERVANSVIVRWHPPSVMEFIEEIILKKDDGNLTGLIIIDEHGVEINKTFYHDYAYIKDIPVPTKIKSHFVSEEKEIFKELQFRNILIE